jgi:histidinol phosphatase-like enzyme
MKKSPQDLELLKKLSERKTSTVAFDLDGTLAKFSSWKGYSSIGNPVPKIAKLARKCKKAGAYIVIFTCRITTADNKVYLKSVNTVSQWLKSNRIPYDEIWLGIGKPHADYYVDDRAIRVSCTHCINTLTSELILANE